MRVGLYDHPAFREHDAGAGHPERPARLDAVRRGIREAALESRLALMTPRPASRDELRAVHGAAHVDRVAATEGRTYRFDPDTQAGPHSYTAALLAAGAAVDAVDRVLAGELDRAFCAVRPPGHHAEADRAMGFCLFNNVAVGAAHALARGYRRVLIVDFDVHHGNGTQDAFYADPRVLYVSTHAFPFYPGTGALSEVGLGPGRGYTVNLPLPSGCGDPEFIPVYEDVVVPLGRAFEPDLLLVSAGFDAHAADPLAGMRVSSRGFGRLAAACLSAAGASCRGAVFVVEGGYDLAALATSAAEVVRCLLGMGTAGAEVAKSPAAQGLLEGYRRALGSLWPVLLGPAG
jgi:acetoin utilization deacetylase AcuC-like enzyme